MFRIDFNRILTLVQEAGRIEGRKKFQKIAFILQAKGEDFPERFKYHYYGPFSDDLQMEIDDLVDMELLIEKKCNNTFSYEISSNVFNLEKHETIVKKRDLIKFLNDIDAHRLELVSTIYFLEREGCIEENLIEKKLKILKPHLIELLPDSFKIVKKINEMCEHHELHYR